MDVDQNRTKTSKKVLLCRSVQASARVSKDKRLSKTTTRRMTRRRPADVSFLLAGSGGIVVGLNRRIASWSEDMAVASPGRVRGPRGHATCDGRPSWDGEGWKSAEGRGKNQNTLENCIDRCDFGRCRWDANWRVCHTE